MSGANDDTGMPRVGDDTFKGPGENTLRSKPTPKQEKDIETSLKEMDETSSDTPAVAEASDKPLTPAQIAAAYEKGLMAVNLTIQDARGIIENLVVNMFHEETTRIGPLTFRYRSRSHSDTLRTYGAVESSGIAMPEAMQEFINRHNTAASLVSWGDNKFEHPLKEAEAEVAFTERFDFLTVGISTLVAVKMMQIVHDFDKKMAAVMADGAPQDF